MQKVDRSQDVESIVEYPASVIYADGTAEIRNEEVQAEHTLDVYVDGKLSMRIVCTPCDLVELVVGRLFTEGIIESVDDVELVHLCEFSTKARVLLANKQRQLSDIDVPVVPSCCTGNRVYAAIEHANDEGSQLEPVVPMPWKPEWIFGLASMFKQDTPMHKRTFGAHSCFLSKDGEVLYCCEDLGRHNAFDKVIGHALCDGVDLSSSIICTSGRLPVDMVTKAIRARVPLLVSKAVPTDLTIELAREFDLTLICCARPDSIRVYHDPANPIDTPIHAHQWKVPRLFDADSQMGELSE